MHKAKSVASPAITLNNAKIGKLKIKAGEVKSVKKKTPKEK